MQQNTPSPKKGFNPLILIPVVAGIMVATIFVCAATFVAYALFFYEANPPELTKTRPTMTVEIVQFSKGKDEPPTLAPPTNTPVKVEATATVLTIAATVTPTVAVTATVPLTKTAPVTTTAPTTKSDTITTTAVATKPTVAPTKAPSYPVPTINTAPVTMSSPDYGMQVFLFWKEEIADRDLKLVQEADFRWVKQEFAWREIEGASKGAFDWSRTDRIMNQIDAHGLKVIVRLGVQPKWAAPSIFPEVGPPDNMQDFADFITAVATRYKGRIDAYQIWNEPNLSREWGNRPTNAAEYTAMLKVAYQAVKAVDPFPIVISAGMAPTTRNDDVARPDTYYIQEMYKAGAKPYFDALGAHGPGFKAAPETDPAEIAKTPGLANPGDFEAKNNVPEELRRVYGFRHVEDVRKIMVDNGDAGKKVVLLEFGWTVDPRPNSPYKWHAVSQDEQAAYFGRAYQYAKANWQPWIGIMSLIYVASPQWTRDDEQTYWCVIYPGYPELNVAPAYYKLKEMRK